MANLNITGNLTEQGKRAVCVESSGGGYIRLTNGQQICWGQISTNTGNQTITFPQPFKSGETPRVAMTRTQSSGGTYNANFNWLRGLFINGTPTNTSFSVQDFNGEGASRNYIAIGLWK